MILQTRKILAMVLLKPDYMLTQYHRKQKGIAYVAADSRIATVHLNVRHRACRPRDRPFKICTCAFYCQAGAADPICISMIVTGTFEYNQLCPCIAIDNQGPTAVRSLLWMLWRIPALCFFPNIGRLDLGCLP